MIQRILLLAGIIFGISLTASAQCTPDTSISIPGLYPDTITGLPAGTVGTPYNQVIQVVVFTDTTFNGLPVLITNITITSVSGLPPGITYQCVPSNCVFPGGGNGCILLTGTPTTTGNYPIQVNLDVNGTTFGIPLPSQPAVLNGYSILVNQSTGLTTLSSEPVFKLLPNYPNPANEYTEVSFTTPVGGDFKFSIYNILGREVYAQDVRAKRGLNTNRVNTSEMSAGVYLMLLDNGREVITRKMVVSGK